MGEQLNAAQLLLHPEYPHTTWKLEPVSAGICASGKGRGGPWNIAYQLHGHGPTRVVLIMGLGGYMSSWQRQTKDLAHLKADRYTVLILDNRGMGKSDKPAWPRYTTSSMAQDVLEVLDEVGWTEERSVNAVSVSLGGMIAQELAFIAPERLASLMLVSTAARLVNTVGFFENLRQRMDLFIPRSMDDKLRGSKARLYTEAFLHSPDTTEHVVQAFPTHGDRLAASELAKRRDTEHFKPVGFISQAIAAGWHHKSAAQLQQLAERVGRDRILVIHGELDRMITFPHGETLVAELNAGAEPGKEIRHKFWRDQAHVIPIERRAEFNALVEEHIANVASRH